MGLLTVNSSRVGGTYIFLVICYLPAAPILMTLAAGYPHRPWQFPRRGWLPVPDGMVFDERFFFCRSIIYCLPTRTINSLLPIAPRQTTLAAGYPHRRWQFPFWGWLPVPDGMVFDERFFFCRSTSIACISHGLTALCASLLVSSHEHFSWSAGTVCTSHGRHSRGLTALCAHLLDGNFFRTLASVGSSQEDMQGAHTSVSLLSFVCLLHRISLLLL